MNIIETEEREITELLKTAKEEPFKFFVSMDENLIQKSLQTDNLSDDKSWKVGGFASSTRRDLEGEIIVPGGIDFEYFLNYGFYNDDHQRGSSFKVGRPEEAYTNEKGFYTKGYLFKTMPAAIGIYNLMKTLASGIHGRRVGFSVEGKTLLQDGNKILKCWIKDIAITPAPINQDTYADLLKGFSGCSFYRIGNKIVHPCDSSMEARQVLKALEAGQEIANQTGGDALRVQDLERKLKILTNRDGLSEDELCEYAMMKGNFDKDTASRLVEYAKLLKTVEMKKTFYPSAPAGIV